MDDKNIEIDALVVRFLQGTSDKDEKARFFSWLISDHENATSYFQMKEIYDSRKRAHETGRRQAKTKRLARSRRFVKYMSTHAWMRYAAIITVVFGSALIVNLLQNPRPFFSSDRKIVYVKNISVHNTRGVYAVSLPDGSKVWLHGASTLTYPEQFSDSIRTVELQGEAYFDVQANEQHPFVVQTPTAKVRATGTEFNITAYPDEQTTTVTLVKGTVAVQPNNLTTSVKLKAGQQAVAGDNEAQVSRVANVTAQPDRKTPTTQPAKDEKTPVFVHNINTELYTDWKDGVYRFRNEPFQNIALRLEKMYGVDIIIEDEKLKKSAFSGMFTTDYSLKEVFEIINISNPVSYTVKDKVVTIINRKK